MSIHPSFRKNTPVCGIVAADQTGGTFENDYLHIRCSEFVVFLPCCHPERAFASRRIFAPNQPVADGMCVDPSTLFHSARDDMTFKNSPP